MGLRCRAGAATHRPPDFERDVWVIWQMTYSTLLEIGWGQHAEDDRAALVDELARLVVRVLYPGSAEALPGQK